MIALGIDLGDDHVRALRVNERGDVIARSARSPGRAGLASTLRDVLRAPRSKDGATVEPLGVALLWAADEVPTEVTTTLAQGAPRPVLIGVGAATALAEAWCGAARGSRDLIAFGVGEHVTAGVLVDGVVLRGAHGYAGSIEWLSLNPVERADYRRYGGLGAEVSAAGIVRRVVWRIKSGDRSAVAESVGGDLSRITADLVFAASHAGDGVSISVVRDTARYVAMAVSNMAAVLDPETVVLGGILATSGAQMLDAIRAECSRRMRPSQAGRVTVVLSTLGADAAAIGAARAALLQRQ